MAEEKKEIAQTMEYSNRIGVGVRDEMTSGAINMEDLSRNFEKRGLRKNTPFPNIIRIEQLDGDSRDRYSSGITNAIDKLHSAAETGRIGGIQKEVFYGFLKTQPDSQRITMAWKDRGGIGNLISMATATVAAPATAVANVLGFGTQAAQITQGVSGLVSAATSIVDGTSQLAGELAGINSGIVGQNTIKRLDKVGMQSFGVTCSWYLPEQYALYCKGIRSLFRIAYPNEVSIGDSIVMDQAKERFSKGVESINNSSGGPEVDMSLNKLQSAVKWVGDKIQWAATKFGMTFSVDPSPVRVSIGESWDLEPLIITGLIIKPSKETFIEPTTHAHLPITVEAQINLDYWITPRSGQENMAIAGQEIFGWLQEDRHVNVIHNTQRYVNEKNKNMWDTLSQGKLNSNASNRRGMNM